MPRKEIDYSNTIIYKIFCRDINIKELYIGHTTNFVNRKYQHHRCSNDEKCKSKLYTYIRANGGWDNWKILILEDVECKNFEDARKVEQSYIDKYNSGLNTAIAYSIKDEIENLIIENKNIPKKINEYKKLKYNCDECNFSSSNKKDYNRHLLSDKHKKRIDINFKPYENRFECKCGKTYLHNASLFNHKKVCKFKENCQEIKEEKSNSLENKFIHMENFINKYKKNKEVVDDEMEWEEYTSNTEEKIKYEKIFEDFIETLSETVKSFKAKM